MPTETTAEEIVARIVSDMTAVLKRRNKSFSKGALGEWSAAFLKTVQESLDNGAKWASSRATVRLVARDMARIAALLSGSKTKVGKAQVDAAFCAIKGHVECSGIVIRGRWCDFKI